MQNGTVNQHCSTTCQITSIPSCGNASLQIGEECDDGNTSDFDGCTSLCRIEQNYCKNGSLCVKNSCSTGVACDVASVGDGLVQSALSEECDDGNSINDDDCDNNGKWVALPECGDGVLLPEFELCDAGDKNSYQPNAECRPNCVPQRCGDGILDDFIEECDDGNNLNGDSCSFVCTLPFGSVPPTTISGATPPTTIPGGYEGNIPTPARTPTGPGLLIFIATGAAAGIGIVRRRLLDRK